MAAATTARRAIEEQEAAQQRLAEGQKHGADGRWRTNGCSMTESSESIKPLKTKETRLPRKKKDPAMNAVVLWAPSVQEAAPRPVLGGCFAG